MKPFTLPLSDSQANLETVGGKGMSLAKMINAGFPIPDGFHITTEAYRAFIEANQLQTKILAALKDVDATLPATLETVSVTIGRFFADAQIPTDLAATITEAYAALPHPLPLSQRERGWGEGILVAVRSSATAEDLPEASFAGQQETFLNIRGEEALLEAVKKCWASLWTARAIAYRIKNNIDQNTVALAVVAQEMVNAEAAGILFTANPMNGRRDEMVINAAWGLGEAIVGGLVSPDIIVVDKATGKVKKVDVAEKTVITVLTESGTREESLNDARRSSQVMNEAQVIELVNIARRIESFYGSPQDIEWCYVVSPSPSGRGARGEDNFYVVQSRPITALPPEPVQWTLPRPKLMMARGSLAEHLPNAVSPLFGTLGLRPVNKATAELGDFMGGIDLLEAEYQYRVINGYVYFGFLMSAKFMWAMIKVTFTSLGLMFGRSKERWLEARAIFANAITPWEKKQAENLSPSELLEGVRAVMYAAGKYYTVIQSSTLPSASSSELIFTGVYKMVSRKDEPKAETLLFGLETVPLRAEKSLFDLGMWIREHPALRDLTFRTPTEELVAALKADSHPETIPAQEWDEFKSRLEKHSDEFGHTSFEFDFMNPTPAEIPKLILDSIKMYAEGKGSDPYARQREVVEKREQTLQKIRNRFKLIPNRWFDKALKWAMDTGPAREDSLADMGMGHTIVRRMLGELGQRFVGNGAIENAEDIYWLVEDEVNELASMLERSEKLPNYSDKAPARKAEWREQMKLVPPAMLPEKSGWAKLIPWNRENMSGNVLKGLGASAGKVTATACVMFAPEDFNKMKPGDVLVAVITTPAWTPLFTMASAIVTDIGGPLSHSSIVAREYGIPAVLATGSGTRRIQDGQTITVDGSAGTVTLN
ncbi:MAG: pyruvate, phosphate dikinase [Chloroflexi bacterium]|nr:pyruvate, phosphate dikinase [Chloroflexota bacterium]